ncbi:MAG: GNAT family N-acetyltransferase [Desulfosarcinaceae bacterium]
MIHFQKAEVADFLAIAELDRRAWKHNRNTEFVPDGEHAWRVWVEHALCFTAKEENVLLGAICAFPCMSGMWCVSKVFIEYEKRGMGIGTKLFQMLLAELDKLKVDSFLTVDPIYEHAVRLYEKWGYTEKEFVKGYFRPNEDRYVMTRKAR